MNKPLTSDEFRDVVRQQIEGTSIRQAASERGFSHTLLADALRGTYEPTDKLALAFGYERVVEIIRTVTYRKIA